MSIIKKIGNYGSGPGSPSVIKSGSGSTPYKSILSHITVIGNAGDQIVVTCNEIFTQVPNAGFILIQSGLAIDNASTSTGVKVFQTLASVDLAQDPNHFSSPFWVQYIPATLTANSINQTSYCLAMRFDFSASGVVYVSGA